MSTEQQKQRVSALVDGEVNRFEAAATVRDLLQSSELAGCWERWHLIGHALREEPTALAARSTAARVRDAIAAEQSAPAPAPRHRLHRAWRPVMGAVAAGLLVLGLAVILTAPVETPWRQAPGIAQPSRGLDGARWQQSDPAVRARLDRMLVNHQEQVAGPGRTGVAAYAAVIGYEQRP
jgi:sigma-E factor negative regulatory protein RseA